MVVFSLRSGDDFFRKIEGKLIVSSQALKDEPLYGPEIMAKMARAAAIGGAVAIRANGASDIRAIKKEVDLPIIGLVKRDYPDSDVYITATKKEIDELLAVGVSMIALDATFQTRPNGESLETLIRYLKEKGQRIMADISTLEEGKLAARIGVDCVSTTLSGYTSYSRQLDEPDFQLIEELSQQVKIPVIAEGRVSTPEQAKKALECGAYAVVVGSAITRPQLITESFVKQIAKIERRV